MRNIFLSFLFLLLCVPLLAQEATKSLFPKNNNFLQKKEEAIQFELVWSKNGIQKGEEIIAALKMNLAKGFHINPAAHMIPTNYVTEVIPTKVTIKKTTAGAQAQAPIYNLPVSTFSPIFNTNMLYYKDESYIFIPIKIGSNFNETKLELSLEIYYQMCDERDCFRPKTEAIEGSIEIKEPATIEKTNPTIFTIYESLIKEVVSPEQNTTLAENTSSILLIQVLFALLGGLLLNFTPCVLPVIPLKIMSLSSSAGSRKKSFFLGLVMSLGVIAFWVVIGYLISALPNFNAVSKLFQNSYFTITVGIVIAIMAVGMCGLFSFRVPQKIATINPKFSSVAGSFGVGVMTAILSTPCTAPFMGSALAWALKQPQHITLLIFLTIGVGMALPYFILSSFPSLVSWMPKAGPVSVVIKETMGIFMLAAAAYFIGIGLTTTISSLKGTEYYWWPAMLIAVFAGLWIIIQTIRLHPTIGKRVFFVLLGATIATTSLLILKSLIALSPLVWESYTPELLKTFKAENKTILIDFTADYCINCKYLEKTVLNHTDTVKLLKDHKVSLIKVDITDEKDVENLALLNEEGSLTIPYIVIYKNGKRVLNADFFTKEDLAKILTE